MSNAVKLASTGYDEMIIISEEKNFHIEAVEVSTCADDCGPETDGYIITPREGYRLNIYSKRPGRCHGRYRGEPAVRLILQPENRIDAMELCIYHHKGSIYLRASDLPHIPEEC